MDSVIIAQRKALETLRILNIELYKKAIQLDTNLMPFSAMGPYYTPPIPGYIQDGEYEDTTKKYEIVYVDTEAHMKSILRGKTKRRSKKSEEE